MDTNRHMRAHRGARSQQWTLEFCLKNMITIQFTIHNLFLLLTSRQKKSSYGSFLKITLEETWIVNVSM